MKVAKLDEGVAGVRWFETSGSWKHLARGSEEWRASGGKKVLLAFEYYLIGQKVRRKYVEHFQPSCPMQVAYFGSHGAMRQQVERSSARGGLLSCQP